MATVSGYGQAYCPIVTVAAAGIVEVTGSGTPSFPLAEMEGIGRVEVAGTGAPGLPLAEASGVGSVDVTGTGAITLPLPTLKTAADGEVTGTGAITLPAPKLISGRRYNLTIEYAPQNMDRDMAEVGEVFDIVYFTEFRDTLPFDITLKTDYSRFSCAVPFDENVEVVSNQAAAGQPLFRHFIQMVVPEGFWGSIFEMKMIKQIPGSGLFKAFGYAVHVIPRPGMAKEFIASSDAIANGW